MAGNACRAGMRLLGSLDRSFVHQQDGNVVPYRISTMARRALQTLAAVFRPQLQRLLARWADQYVEPILGNHAPHSTPRENSKAATDLRGLTRINLFS